MAKMTKSTKTNIKEGRYGKRESWYGNTAIDLKEWSLKPDSIELDQFFTDRDIPEATFYSAIEQNDEMKAAHAYAKSRIGINRLKIGVEQRANINSVIGFTLPQYLKSYKNEHIDRAKLKQDEENKDKIVIIEKFKDE